MRIYQKPKNLDEDEDIEMTCPRCGKVFYAWLGMSVVECPQCGKVFL